MRCGVSGEIGYWGRRRTDRQCAPVACLATLRKAGLTFTFFRKRGPSSIAEAAMETKL